MFAGRTVFAQLIDHVPPHEFHKCVARYRGNYKLRGFSCLDQFLCLAFAQLTFRESLRDINGFPNGKPKRDIVATDGMKITLGGRTVTIYLMPGHTPGTISGIFQVHDHGKPLTVAPPGTPHWWKEVPKSITLYAVNTQ